MAARRPRDGAVAAAADENANPCKKARVDDDLLRRTMATIGAPPEAPPDPSATPPHDVVRHLDTHGYCPLVTDTETVDTLRQALADASDNDNASVLQNDRRGRNLEATPSLKNAVVALIERSPFLHDYVGDDLRVQGVQDIVVSKACPPQEIHRDHQLGAKKAIVVAISLDGTPLGTEVIRGTHAGDDDLSAYVARNRYSSKRAPKAAAMIEHLKQSGAMTAVQSACMVYDPFVYHRGAASAGPKTGGRLFIMLCASSLSADDQKAMRSTNDIKRAWKIPPVARPPQDEEESLGEDSPEAAARYQMQEIQDQMEFAIGDGDYERAEELRGQGVNLEAAFFPEWSDFARTRIPHAVYLRSYLKDE